MDPRACAIGLLLLLVAWLAVKLVRRLVRTVNEIACATNWDEE